jgi:phosphate transport system substrate-binding protein
MRHAWIATATVAVALAATASAEESRAALVVKGSDTIGGELGPALARAYEAAHPGKTIRWEALGSATAFPGLFDGSADIGAASRPVNAKELAEAKDLALELKEYVLGFDGIAVIVNPANRVAQLPLDVVGGLFTGAISDWSAAGGAPGPVHVVSRPSYSGTHGFFKEKVLRRGRKDGAEEFSPGAKFMEKSEDVIKEVARDPLAIGYVGMGTLRRGVTVVAVGTTAQGPFLVPDAQTVRTGQYAIYRPLLLYTRGEPRGEVRRFLSFIFAGDGRRLIAAHDFIPGDAPDMQQLPAEGADRATAPGARVFRVRFDYGQATIDTEGRETLQAVVAAVSRMGGRVRLIGNADAAGRVQDNRRIALIRVNKVADRLSSMGVSRAHMEIEVRGSDSPLATNGSAAGRRENRRVDVEILPRR